MTQRKVYRAGKRARPGVRLVYNGAEPAQMAEQSTGGNKKTGAMQSLVQVESLIQLALMLPVATVVGWLIGLGLDKWLHQHWIYIVGLILGAAAGFVEIFRVVLKQAKE
jgi:ATP synthase protein I